MTAILAAAIVLYFVLSAVLCIYAMNLALYSWRTWRRAPVESIAIDLDSLDVSEVPYVTVQLPVFNELYVAERAIRAAMALEWPTERLQIQVLDDSTDETVDVVAAVVAEARLRGFNIEHLHRSDRTGYKAGALGEGLKSATGEYIAMFDADFVPTPDFLVRALPAFDAPDIAFVQARWGHLNRDHSFMTRFQAIALDAHFLIDQASRGQAGYWFNFNGTAGVWRHEAIIDAGGWKADTLTEDLDLSYRAHLAGWRANYLEDLVAPAELPVDISGFRRQQHRWATGSLTCAVRLLPQVLKTNHPLSTRYQAAVHLTSYSTHLLLLALVLLYPVFTFASLEIGQSTNLFGFGYVLALMSLMPTVFFLTGQLHRSNRHWPDVPWVFLVSMFGSGLMLNTGRAFVQMFTKREQSFERTAKFGLDASTNGTGRAAWAAKRYTLKLDRIILGEVVLAIYSFACAWYAYTHRNWGIVFFATFFGIGLLGISAVSISHGRAKTRSVETSATPASTSTLSNPAKVRRAMIVMAKRPAAGQTKTRLTPDLTPEQAADLYENFLHDIVAMLDDRADITLFIAVDAPESAEWFSRFAPDVPQINQVGDDLGQRLDSVLSAALDAGYDQVFAISSDSPDLPAGHVTDAIELLDDPTNDIVLGPTEDGGYYLIGWKQRWRPMVVDVTMSTSRVLADTLTIADELGAQVALAPGWYDIDVPEDLERLRASSATADVVTWARTSRFLADLGPLATQADRRAV